MATNPPVNYLALYTDKDLYKLWEERTARLKEAAVDSIFGPPEWMEIAVDRVEKEMARRNLPIPGEDTFRNG